MKNSFRKLYVWETSVELALYERETQLEVIIRARIAKDVSGVRDMIAHIGAGLSRMIDQRDAGRL